MMTYSLLNLVVYLADQTSSSGQPLPCQTPLSLHQTSDNILCLLLLGHCQYPKKVYFAAVPILVCTSYATCNSY